jgi:hypothetical protein
MFLTKIFISLILKTQNKDIFLNIGHFYIKKQNYEDYSSKFSMLPKSCF